MAAVNVPCVLPFDVEIGESQAALGPKWDKWLLRFENYMTVIAIQEDGQKKALLLHAVGGNTFDIFMSLADHGTTYNHAKAALTNYFKPKVNKEYERAVFRRLRQETGETIDVYHTRLRKAAASCDFADVDGEIKSHVIQTTTDSKLRKQGLTDDTLTVRDIVVAGRNNELAQAQNAEMEKDLHCGADKHVQTIQHRPGCRNRHRGNNIVDKRVEIAETNTHMSVVLNRAQRLAEHVIFVNKQIILQNSVPKT